VALKHVSLLSAITQSFLDPSSHRNRPIFGEPAGSIVSPSAHKRTGRLRHWREDRAEGISPGRADPAGPCAIPPGDPDERAEWLDSSDADGLQPPGNAGTAEQ
jgi:hypothetical protein